MVKITAIGSDECGLTGRRAEGCYVEFEDGTFNGFLSWKALKQLLSMKDAQAGKETGAGDARGQMSA